MTNYKEKHKTLFTAVLLLILLIAGNGILSLLLEPYMGSSQEMWESYAAHEAPELICLGTSQGLSAVKPSVIEAKLGVTAYNMSTNMQSPANSLAALEIVLKDQKKREAAGTDTKRGLSGVILILDHEVLRTKRSDNFRADASFWHGRACVASIKERMTNAIRFMTSQAFFGKPISLVYFAPWTYNRSAAVLDNIRRKLSSDPDRTRDADGYEASYDIVDQSIPFVPASGAERWSLDHTDLIRPSLLKENREVLEEICVICKDNGIVLYPVVPPYPNCYNIYNVEAYRNMNRDMEQLFDAYGYRFIDFNAAEYEGNPELPRTDEFKDVGHMNDAGAEKFSAYLAEYVLK